MTLVSFYFSSLLRFEVQHICRVGIHLFYFHAILLFLPRSCMHVYNGFNYFLRWKKKNKTKPEIICNPA